MARHRIRLLGKCSRRLEDDSLTQDFHEYAHSTHGNSLDIMNSLPCDKLLYQSSLHFTLNGRLYRQPHQPRLHSPPRGCPFSERPQKTKTNSVLSSRTPPIHFVTSVNHFLSIFVSLRLSLEHLSRFPSYDVTQI